MSRNRIRIGVVLEGELDELVFDKLVPAAVKTISSKNLVTLQPTIDKTSDKGQIDGGWTGVMKWCLGNAPELRRGIVKNNGLFESDDPENLRYNALLIHLDSDICKNHGFQKNSGVNPGGFNLNSSKGRGKYIAATLTKWLWPEGDDHNDSSWTVFAVAVESVETWLIAAISDEANPEEIRDPLSKLKKIYKEQKIGGSSRKDQKFRKHSDTYQKIAVKAAKETKAIADKCPHFSLLVNSVSDLSMNAKT